jgi:hypothetical protein
MHGLVLGQQHRRSVEDSVAHKQTIAVDIESESWQPNQ